MRMVGYATEWTQCAQNKGNKIIDIELAVMSTLVKSPSLLFVLRPCSSCRPPSSFLDTCRQIPKPSCRLFRVLIFLPYQWVRVVPPTLSHQGVRQVTDVTKGDRSRKFPHGSLFDLKADFRVFRSLWV